MKYCSHCGAEINDDAVICVNCGCSVESPEDAATAQRAAALGKVAKVFYIITLVVVILYAVFGLINAITETADETLRAGYIGQAIGSLISLCWVVPMYLSLSHAD